MQQTTVEAGQPRLERPPPLLAAMMGQTHLLLARPRRPGALLEEILFLPRPLDAFLAIACLRVPPESPFVHDARLFRRALHVQRRRPGVGIRPLVPIPAF